MHINGNRPYFILGRSSRLVLSEETGLRIGHSAKMTSDKIRLIQGAQTLPIESELKRGNSALKDHLTSTKLTRDLRDSAIKKWVGTILAEFHIDPKSLNWNGKKITKLIPKMAKLILETPELGRGKYNDGSNSSMQPSAPPQAKEDAAVALYKLSENVANHPALVEAGVHTQLVSILVDTQVDHVAKVYAAAALYKLSENVANNPALVADGVHAQLCAILVDRQASAHAKEAAAVALYKLSANVANHPALVAADVHKQLGALLMGAATPIAKKAAAGALYNLSENVANRPALVADGVYTPLGVLLMGAATPIAKEAAAVALFKRSANVANHPALVADGVHAQLGAILVDRQASAHAKKAAADALYKLSANVANRPALIADGVHEQLVALLNDPEVSSDVKDFAAGALCNLSANEANRQCLVEADAHGQLDKLLNNEAATPDAKRNAAGALLNLSSHFDPESLNCQEEITKLIPEMVRPHSPEQCITTDLMGNMFKGQVDASGKRSNGKLITRGGHIYEGGFEDGRLEGKGTHTLPDGKLITGEFRQGNAIGAATLTWPNGRKIEFQATYTDVDQTMTREDLHRNIAAPAFIELLTGGKEGTLKGHVLPLISAHLKYLDPTTPQMTKLASQLDFAAEIENEEAFVSMVKIKERLNVPNSDNEIVIRYGMTGHAMLLKLKFTSLGLEIEIYNSGLGLKRQDRHPQKEVNKYNTCKEKFYPAMCQDSEEFDTLLIDILNYPTFKTIDQSYAVFAGAKDVVGGTPNWQREQKGGNCTLECVMAFLKKNMTPADYLQYRMTLISDVKTQAELYRDHYKEEKPDPKVFKRLDEMLENRKSKAKKTPGHPNFHSE